MDIFAAFSLVGAASRENQDPQLFADAEMLYGVYQKLEAKTLTIESLPAAELKALLQTVARVSAVASKLVEDPVQLANLSKLLSSL